VKYFYKSWRDFGIAIIEPHLQKHFVAICVSYYNGLNLQNNFMIARFKQRS